MNSKKKHHLTRIFLRQLSLGIIPLPELYDYFSNFRSSKTELDDQITAVSESLGRASGLIEELSSELDSRKQELSRTRGDIEKFKALAAAEEKNAKPLLEAMEATINKGKWPERIVSLIANLIVGALFFVAGAMWGPDLANYLRGDQSQIKASDLEIEQVEGRPTQSESDENPIVDLEQDSTSN